MFALFLGMAFHALNLHVPHDDVHGIATAQLASGVEVTVIATSRDSQVLHTTDRGLSWRPVFGDGLELARADIVVWDPHPDAQHFVIGGDVGIWSFDPVTGRVEKFNQGLPTDLEEVYACQFAVPNPGTNGPLLMINKVGDIWAYQHALGQWQRAYRTGIADPRGQIAIVPNYDAASSDPRRKSIVAAAGGILFYSDDAGLNWRKHPQFRAPATQPDDPLISAVAFADDYEVSGNMVLATSVPETWSFSGDKGMIYQSSDFGISFQLAQEFNTSIRSIVATPVGPSGNRWFMASPYAHPRFIYPDDSYGILRSNDGGLTWDDYGSWQDFAMEIDSAETVPGGRALIHDFEVLPDFATTGRVIFGRSEGLYYSDDEGYQWIRRSYRPSAQIRGIDAAIDQNGDLIAFAGGYGTGTLRHNLTTGTVDVLSGGTNSYVHGVACSPRYNLDGMLIVGGWRGPSIWYDPAIGAVNPHNTLGWMGVSLDHHIGYVRGIAFSPDFDARGVPGSDQVFFISTSSEQNTNFVTMDGGKSLIPLDELTDGSPAPFLRYLAVAPSFDSTLMAGPQDVYGVDGKDLYRLNGTQWELIYHLPKKVRRITAAPDFDRDPGTPGLPRLFIAMQTAPYVMEFIDEFGNPTVIEHSAGVGEATPVSLACPSNFASTQTVYMATFSSGVKKIDLSQPSPEWVPVGLNFPDLWLSNMTLAPNFHQNPTLIIGSQDGVIYCKDEPGEEWQFNMPPTLRDNEAPEFQYYAPGQAGVVDDSRTWRWEITDTFATRQSTDLKFIDNTMHTTSNDGSYFEASEYSGDLKLHTFRGPECGSVTITVENYWTGTFLGTKTVDLSASKWQNWSVAMTFPFQPVRIRVEANLDPGELFHFDGMTFGPR